MIFPLPFKISLYVCFTTEPLDVNPFFSGLAGGKVFELNRIFRKIVADNLLYR